MREGLADGTIDIVATDHAPHARHDKEHAFADAVFGMLGLEQALAVVHTTMVATSHAIMPTTITGSGVRSACGNWGISGSSATEDRVTSPL